MKKLLRLAAVAVALTMFVSAAAEAQGGGGAGAAGGGARGGGGGQRGGGRGGVNAIVAEGVSADSAYNLLLRMITLDATKKAAVMKLVTTFQVDMKANPAPRGGGRGGAADAAAPPVDTVARNAAIAKRNTIINAFRTEVKKSLDATQATQFDMNVPDPTAARRGGGGGGGN